MIDRKQKSKSPSSAEYTTNPSEKALLKLLYMNFLKRTNLLENSFDIRSSNNSRICFRAGICQRIPDHLILVLEEIFLFDPGFFQIFRNTKQSL